MKFRKKPVVIDAFQFTEAMRDSIVLGDAPCPEGIRQGSATYHKENRKVWSATFYVDTLEGRMDVSLDDWIIKGVKGEFYPCKPDIFAATYEPA